MTFRAKSAAVLSVALSMLLAGSLTAAAGRDRIEGVVKETRTVAGKTYATISVGSDDAVRRNTRLTVVGRKGQVLGSITVTQIEPEEAIGVLSGPRINEIRPDDRVTNADPKGDDDGRVVTSLPRP